MRLIDLDRIDWDSFPADFAVYAEMGSVKSWLDSLPKVTAFAFTDSQDPAIMRLGEEAKAALQFFIRKYLDCCMASVKEREAKK